MPRKLESLMIRGPAGRLEALLEEPEGGAPRQACLVCHPHPLYGGTMHNKVVYRLARALRHSGAVVLRFNFRGAGASEGVHDHGAGETGDAGAALAFLRARYPDLPWSLAGFSFGARVVLKLACSPPLPARVIAAGCPTRAGLEPEFPNCPVEKVFIQSTHDQYGPREELERIFESLPDPKRLIWVEARDHFFAGALDDIEQAVRNL